MLESTLVVGSARFASSFDEIGLQKPQKPRSFGQLAAGVQFPGGGYSMKCVVLNDQLISSNFGGSNILFFEPENGEFDVLELNDYETGCPVSVQKYSPGDLVVVNDRIFAGQIFSDFVLVIDPHLRKVIERIPVGGEGDFAYSSAKGDVFFASNNRNSFFRINPTSYQFEEICYPGSSLNIGSAFCHPESGLLYLDLHRTSSRDLDGFNRKMNGLPQTEFSKANSYIAIYDPDDNEYIAQFDLAINTSDRTERCWPMDMVYDEHEKLLYIGMLSSHRNIYLLDTQKNQIINSIRSEPNSKNQHNYVDSLSLAFYKSYLLSISRSNYELSIFARQTMQELISIPLGGTGSGPRHVCVHEDKAYISHWEYDGLIVVDLKAVTKLLSQ